MTRALLLTVLAAACGGGSAKPAPVTPPPADPVPRTEPVATEPVSPAEPARPDDPPAPDPAKIKAELLAAERAAFEQARPVFDRHCARCHAKGGALATAKKLDHFDMTAYPLGGHHATEVSKAIRKTLAISGGKATMPFDKKGAVQGDELALIAAWADAFDASGAGGAHEDRGGAEP